MAQVCDDCNLVQVGIDVTGEAVQRAGRKLVTSYKQAQDPLSGPLQQLGGLAEGAKKAARRSVSKQLPSSDLYHGDIATASATNPGTCYMTLNTLISWHLHVPGQTGSEIRQR